MNFSDVRSYITLYDRIFETVSEIYCLLIKYNKVRENKYITIDSFEIYGNKVVLRLCDDRGDCYEYDKYHLIFI